MPVVRVAVSFPDLEQAVEEIEKTCKIVAMASDGAGSLFIITEPHRRDVETRTAR